MTMAFPQATAASGLLNANLPLTHPPHSSLLCRPMQPGWASTTPPRAWAGTSPPWCSRPTALQVGPGRQRGRGLWARLRWAAMPLFASAHVFGLAVYMAALAPKHKWPSEQRLSCSCSSSCVCASPTHCLHQPCAGVMGLGEPPALLKKTIGMMVSLLRACLCWAPA